MIHRQLIRLLCLGLSLVGAWGSTPAVYAQQQVEQNVDRGGSDYDNFDMRANNPLLCMQSCFADVRCKAWTFVKPNTGQGPKPRCWLKTAVPAPTSNGCCASGVISIPNPSPPPPGGDGDCDPPICCIQPDLPQCNP
jgi:hypothetical protein